MENRTYIPSITTTVQIAEPLFKKAKNYQIRFVDAMRVGLTIMLAELGVEEFDNSLSIVRRIQALRRKLEETSQELFLLKQKEENAKG
jgi:hypothetical protein